MEGAIEAGTEREGLNGDGPRIEFVCISEVDERVRNLVKLAVVAGRIVNKSVRPDTSPLIRGSFPWNR